MRIIIGADLVPTPNNYEYFSAGDAKKLLGKELCDYLSHADFRIFNLEVPLTDKETPIPKCGPNLIAPTATVKGYKAIGTDILTLANNHILDQGEMGLNSTLATLKANNIAYLGVGKNLAEADAPYIFTCGDKKIGLYACAEHEFSIITDFSAGANPFDPLETPDRVSELKKQCDYVIVLYHGGKEQYRYPSPNLQKICRKLIDKGADLVLCQHTHCIGCRETYKNGTVVYGQGNFLFDRCDNEFWNTSILVEIRDDFEVSYVPVVKSGETVRMAIAEKAKEILADFEYRSDEIKDPQFVLETYRQFSEKMWLGYMRSLSDVDSNILVRGLNVLTGRRLIPKLLKKRYHKKKMLAIRNYIECEAHRELMLVGLTEKTKHL